MKAIVFDIGNVLVKWDPHLAFLDALGSRAAVDEFLTRVDFQSWNYENDRGRSIMGTLDAFEGPDRDLLAAYKDRFHLTIAEAVPGSWELLDRLAQRYQVHAITNWSAETWPTGVAAHPRLAEVFGVTIVSGAEGLVKPDAAIFALLCERAGLAPGECLFVDDSEKNVAGARAFGMEAHHFTDAATLERDLTARGLL
ncbi:HAD family hydrolase [Plastorhodobacter daqingensis]|uniref:HAD family hydrolase n=1 Tax=Plastorhodobacter daqingensis TaxID=1387281 RepID=A0ABW2UJ44_9RHOB